LGGNLFFKPQIRPHCQGRTMSAGCIFEPAQLDDAGRRRLPQRISVGQSEVVHPALQVLVAIAIATGLSASVALLL
jgi:hypothetical protein